MWKKIIFTIGWSLAISGLATAEKLIITVANIATDKGDIRVVLHGQDNAENFPKTTNVIKINGAEAVAQKAKKGSVKFAVKLPKGVYAVSAYQDLNGNGKLDTNFIGIPTEPSGVSNDAKAFMGPPKFADAKFELNTPVLNIKFNLIN